MRYIKLFPDTDSVQVDKPPADSVQNKVTISGLSILDMERKHHFIHDGTEKALQTSPIAGETVSMVTFVKLFIVGVYQYNMYCVPIC